MPNVIEQYAIEFGKLHPALRDAMSPWFDRSLLEWVRVKVLARSWLTSNDAGLRLTRGYARKRKIIFGPEVLNEPGDFDLSTFLGFTCMAMQLFRVKQYLDLGRWRFIKWRPNKVSGQAVVGFGGSVAADIEMDEEKREWLHFFGSQEVRPTCPMPTF